MRLGEGFKRVPKKVFDEVEALIIPPDLERAFSPCGQYKFCIVRWTKRLFIFW